MERNLRGDGEKALETVLGLDQARLRLSGRGSNPTPTPSPCPTPDPNPSPNPTQAERAEAVTSLCSTMDDGKVEAML